MLFNINTLQWDDDILAELNIPKSMLPEVKPSSCVYGETDFELYGTVQAVVSTLDAVNHLAGKGEIDDCFSLVSNYLEPGGVFLFDLNTPYRFRTAYADRDYVLEEEGAVCCWRSRLNARGDTADFFLTVFEEKDGVWIRRDDVTRERAFGLRAVKNDRV